MPSSPGRKRPRSPPSKRPELVAAGVLSAAAQMIVPGPEVGYREPADAAVPTGAAAWGFYQIRAASPGGTPAMDAPFVRLARQRYYLLGRDSAVAHVLLTHASVSKQHAVVQFRTARWARGGEEGLDALWRKTQVLAGDEAGGDRPDRREEGEVVPWLLDLNSRNGTYINRTRIPPDTFVRICLGDTVVFGASTDECVFVQEAGPPSDELASGECPPLDSDFLLTEDGQGVAELADAGRLPYDNHPPLKPGGGSSDK